MTRNGVFWGVLLSALLIASYIKALNTGVQAWGEPYWVIDYSHGLIKRGLLGQVFSFIYPDIDLSRRWFLVLVWHTAASLLLFAVLLHWAARFFADHTIPALFAVFATSQFCATLAYNTGYLDVYLYLAAAAATLCAAYGKAVPAIVVGLVSPFVHESYIFAWAPAALLLLYDGYRTQCPWTLAAALAPVLPTIAILVFHSQPAAILEMAAAPLPEGVKSGMIQTQFGQTFGVTLRIMAGKFHSHFGNFLICSAFFLIPTVLMAKLYVRRRIFTAEQRWIIFFATLSPAATLLFAWDLSRFLVATTLSALLVVLYAESVWQPASLASERPPWSLWGLSAALLLTPFVYAYFEGAAVINSGILPLQRSPMYRLADWIFVTSYVH